MGCKHLAVPPCPPPIRPRARRPGPPREPHARAPNRQQPRLTVDDGTEIHYELRGPEDGEVVAFLNGILMTTRSWVLQRPVFERRYRCLYHDFRGQLLSDKPEGPYTFERHVADLAALLDHLGIARCHLVGTSYGGEVGLLFAAEHPRRVATLSAISCVSHLEPLLRRQVDLWRAAGADGEALFRISAPFNYSNRFLAADSLLLEQGARRLADYPADFYAGFERLLDCFGTLDLRGRLGEVRCPTLVLCGSEDILKPPHYSAELAAAIPHTEHLLVPGAGHAVVIEKADTVSAAVLGFLAKQRGSARGWTGPRPSSGSGLVGDGPGSGPVRSGRRSRGRLVVLAGHGAGEALDLGEDGIAQAADRLVGMALSAPPRGGRSRTSRRSPRAAPR